MQHNLHKSYVMQIMYKNMNEYDYNEEMPVDTRSEKIMRARLAFSDNYEEMQENVGAVSYTHLDVYKRQG